MLPCQRGIHSRGTRSAVSGHGPAQHGQQTIAPPDAPDAIKAHAVAWATYREALRNVRSRRVFPFKVTWPAPPDETPAGQ
ncbi:phage tail assembly chaperone [Burkholderia ambifaria]|uniref:phage tail assembly chaperone n=1 Tax=Burkholderia ambifaria TaxID=152480 RepID=UPI00158C33BB